MAVNWGDVSRESEAKATRAALRQMPREARLQSAIGRTGNVLNIVAENTNVLSGENTLLLCDTVPINKGVLK